ncbi:uncharacterized protein LOC143082518 [Mytilus galloprovincialis]|uniref:uncharacterized protein LOC143082518 n=1 Tax=Mytilus galloprovincialis TaxID=29158 RepID=UPI003F7BD00F
MRRFSFLGNVFGNRRTSVTSTSKLTASQTSQSPEIDYPYSADDDEDYNERGHQVSDASNTFWNDGWNDKPTKRTKVEIKDRQNKSGNFQIVRKQLEDQKGLHEPQRRISKQLLFGNHKSSDNNKPKDTTSGKTDSHGQDYLQEPKRNQFEKALQNRYTKTTANQAQITDSESDDDIRKKITIALNDRISNNQKSSSKRKRSSKNVKIGLHDRDDMSVSSKDDNWLLREQATNNGVLLHVSLDDMKAMFSDNQTRKQNIKEDYLTSDTDTINTSSNNSGVDLLPHVRNKNKDSTTSKRFLPLDLNDRRSMATTDTCLSVGNCDAERFPTSNQRMSTTEKMKAYILSQARSNSGNYRQTSEYLDECDAYEFNHGHNKNIGYNIYRPHFATDGRHEEYKMNDCRFAQGHLCDSRCSDNLYKDHISSFHHFGNGSFKTCETCNKSTCKNKGTNNFQNGISNHCGFTNYPVHYNNISTNGTRYPTQNNYTNQQFQNQNAVSQHFPVTTHGNNMSASTQGLLHNTTQVPALSYNYSTIPVLSHDNTAVAGLPQTVFPSALLFQDINQVTQAVHHAIGQIVQQPNDPTKNDYSCSITVNQPDEDNEDTRISKEKKENKVLPPTTNPKNTRSKKKQKIQKAGKLRPLALIMTIISGLCGFGVIGVGVWNMMDEDITMYTEVTQEKDNQNFLYFCYGLCFLGILSTIAMLFGFCGLLKLNPCCLKVHWSAEIGGAVLVVAIVALIYLKLDSLHNIPLLTLVTEKVEINLATFLKESLKNNYLDGSPAALSWNRIQIEKSCCGINGIEDYAYSAWTNNSRTYPKKMFPNSCCVVKEKNYIDPEPTNTMMCNLQISGFYHQKGCLEMVMIWYVQNSLITLGVLGGLFLFEIACFLLVFKISRSIVLDQT